MIVLGAKGGEHDACFALVKDGQPLFVYEQERFNRVKHGMSSDITVLFEGLADHGIAPADVDVVANCGDPALLEERLRQVRGYLSGEAYERAAANARWRHPTFRRILTAAGFPEDRIQDVRHHVCHVSSVFYASPYSDAAVLSLDCSGEADTAMLAHCSTSGGIKILETVGLPHSLGRFYEAITRWLGWGFGEEGKTMALAAYGDLTRYRDKMSEVLHVDEYGFFEFAAELADGVFSYSTSELVEQVLESVFGPRRQRDDDLQQRHMDVAAAAQHLCERVMIRLAATLRKRTGSNTLLLTGGVASNSVGNGAIRSAGIFANVVVYPQVTDAGTALGSALYAFHHRSPRRTELAPRWEMKHPFLGRDLDMARVHEAAAAAGVEGYQCEDPTVAAAERLAAGQIVGWVQGRSEVGPRALGNRSILGNPLVPGIKTRINSDVKHREDWRPFAPSVLEEDQRLYFDADESLPYMTVVAPIRPEWRARLTSVSHIDGTARIGSVRESFNPLFYRLIREFKKQTGVGMVLNTSFNDRGEPLVQTCEQALRLFVSSGMDVVLIGDWLFEDKSKARPSEFDPLAVNCRRLAKKPTLVVANWDLHRAQRVVEVLSEERVAPVLAVCAGTEAAELRFSVEVLVAGSRDQFLKTAMRWEQIVVVVPWSAERFVFDPTVYYSDAADACRQLMETGHHEVFWVDPRGQVVSALDVLFVHHQIRPATIPAAYARYWI